MVTTGGDGSRTLRRLIGVYNAEHTWRGELTYLVGSRLGRAHCALCDITHGVLREKAEWRECRSALPVPVDTFHLDDQPEAVRSFVDGRAPVVVGETGDGLVLLLTPGELEVCGGSPHRLVRALEDAVERLEVRWP